MRTTEIGAYPRPLFRWAGSKRALIPQLLQCSPTAFGRYVEPFVGSGCFYLALQPDRAVLGDINSELIHAYRNIAAAPRRVYNLAASIPATARCYYQLRNIEQESLSPCKRAARFLYLNRYCFNGVYRVNRNGVFNVPRGRSTGGLPEWLDFKRCAAEFGRAKLVDCDFEDTLSSAKPGDFVYLDPPYSSTTRTTYGEYAYDAFGDRDLPRLLTCLRQLDKDGVSFLLSFAYRVKMQNYLKGWRVRRVRVNRHVAGFAAHRRSAIEVLVSNY